MNITIRPMAVDDYEGVREVDIQTQKQYLGEEFDQMSDDEKDSHLVSRKSEFQTNVDTGYCFVAEDENTKILGFVLAHETLPFRSKLYIRYIGVNPEDQGLGIGESLYGKLIETAKEKDIREVTGLVNTDNPKSIKLLEKTGFKLHDRKEAILELS